MKFFVDVSSFRKQRSHFIKILLQQQNENTPMKEIIHYNQNTDSASKILTINKVIQLAYPYFLESNKIIDALTTTGTLNSYWIYQYFSMSKPPKIRNLRAVSDLIVYCESGTTRKFKNIWSKPSLICLGHIFVAYAELRKIILQ